MGILKNLISGGKAMQQAAKTAANSPNQKIKKKDEEEQRVQAQSAQPAKTAAEKRDEVRSQRNEERQRRVDMTSDERLRDSKQKAAEKADSYTKPIQDLEDEKRAKSDIWVDGIYMGSDKYVAEAYDKRINKLKEQQQIWQQKADKVDTDEKRDDALAKYRQAVADEQAIAGYATDPLAAAGTNVDQFRVAREQAEDALKEENRRKGNDIYADLSDEARSRDMVEGFEGERMSQYGAALGTAAEWLDYTMNAAPAHPEDYQRGALGDWGAAAFENSKAVAEQAEADWGDFQNGMGEGAQYATNIGKTVANTAADMMANLMVPGAGRLLMGARAAGGGAMTQDQRKKNDIDSRMTKAILDGSVAYLSEWFGGGAEAAYGRSVIGKYINQWANAKGLSSLARRALNTEGLEEGLEYGLGYIGDRILGLVDSGDSFWADWNNRELAENVIVGYLIGCIFNGTAGGEEYPAKRIEAVVDEVIDNKVAEKIASGEMTMEDVVQSAMATPSGNVKIGGQKAAPTKGELMQAEENGEMSGPVEVVTTGTEEMQQSGNEEIAAIQKRGTVSQREAARLYRDPELRADFEAAYGVSLEGKGEKAASQAIVDAVNKQRFHENARSQFGDIPDARPSFEASPEGKEKGQVQYEKAVDRMQKAQKDVAALLAQDSLSNKDVAKIMGNDYMWQALQDVTGLNLEGKGKTAQNIREAFIDAKGSLRDVDASETLTDVATGKPASQGVNSQAGAENAIETGLNRPESKAEKTPDTPRAKLGSGTVSYDGGTLDGEDYAAVDRSSLTLQQKNQIAALEKLAEATGINITFFQSQPGENGKLRGANGAYKDGTVYLDVNAGLSKIMPDGSTAGQVAIVRTAGHELTHFIQEFNETDYNNIRDYMVKILADKTGADGLEALIAEKQRIAKQNGHNLSRSRAVDEIIADGCEMMLKDSAAVETLAKENRSLAYKIRRWIKQWTQKIQEAFQGIDAKSKEAKLLADEAKKIQKMWDDALTKAAKAQGIDPKTELYKNGPVQTAIKTLAKTADADGEGQYNIRAFEHDEDDYKNMLHQVGWSDKKINELFDIVDSALTTINWYTEELDYETGADIDDRVFFPVKDNSDDLYVVSQDFSTLCRKRILQGIIAGELSAAQGRGITKLEGIAVRDALMALQEENLQIEVACALCYVESARMRSQKAINEFLDDPEDSIRNYFAKRNASEVVDDAEMAERAAIAEELGTQYVTGRDGKTKLDIMNPKEASFKKIPEKLKKRIQAKKVDARENYEMPAREQRFVAKARELPVTMFTTPEGLKQLKKQHFEIWAAYNEKVSAASKSKGIESDTWWRAGDSKTISDDLIKRMNNENGLRTQSWSDFQVKHLMDYIAATIELSSRGAMQHAYTKVPDYVELMGDTGVMINMSLIPTREFSGDLADRDFDNVEGFPLKKALDLRETFPETAGTICIGMGDEQIHQLLKSADIDYVIPYHQSGMSAETRAAMHIPAWKDYQKVQKASEVSGDAAKANAKKYGVRLLPETDPNWHKEPKFSEWFNMKAAQKAVTKYGKTGEYGVMTGGYMAMQEAAENYKKLCAKRGLKPKFSYGETDYSQDDNYWKLLIDRKMVNNRTGDMIVQKPLQPTFSMDTINRILNEEIGRYGKVKADQDKATKRVVKAFNEGKIQGGMAADEIAKVMHAQNEDFEITPLAMAADEAQRSDRETEINPYQEAAKAAKREAARFSDRESYNAAVDEAHNEWAPEFYSKMDQTIQKQMPNKMAANQVIPWLTGRGVKAEEIRWSGIEQYLDGKKSVTKDELHSFMALNKINIKTKTIDKEKTTHTVRDLNREYEFDSFEDAYNFARREAPNYGADPEDVFDTKFWNGRFEFSAVQDGEPFTFLEGSTTTSRPRWSKYTLRGGSNYREILFKLPNFDFYSNDASEAHWGEDAPGTIAHARIQDMLTADGKKMLFVEEIQSDLHNAGAKGGFLTDDVQEFQQIVADWGVQQGKWRISSTAPEDVKARYDELKRKLIPVEDEFNAARNRQAELLMGTAPDGSDSVDDIESSLWSRYKTYIYDHEGDFDSYTFRYLTRVNYGELLEWVEDGMTDNSKFVFGMPDFAQNEVDKIFRSLLTEKEAATLTEWQKAYAKYTELQKKRNAQSVAAYEGDTPDVPFAGTSDTYHEYVMKHMLRLAAEGDYDLVGWTTSDQQIDRWSPEYAKGYRIEYDQNLPKFMNKYAKQWGSKTKGVFLDTEGPFGYPELEEVWGVELNDKMKNDVLYVGQPMFQERDVEPDAEAPKAEPKKEAPKRYRPKGAAEILAEGAKPRAPKKVLSEGTGEQKVSRYYSNTMTKDGSAKVVPPHTYGVKSESQSLANAAARLKKDYRGMVKHLMTAEAWSGEMVDAGAIIAQELRKDARRTGDKTAYTEWKLLQEQKQRESARGVQAVAKQSRPGSEIVLSALTAEIAAARQANVEAEKSGKTKNIVPEEILKKAESKVNEISDKMLDLEIEIDDKIDEGMSEREAKEATKDRYLDLIDEINAFRHTGLIEDAGINEAYRKQIKESVTQFRRMLSTEDIDYIQRFAAVDAAGISEDIHYKGKQDFLKRLNTWQKLAQLTGTGTWGRNIIGNASFGLVDVLAANNPVTILADAILGKKTGKRSSGWEWGLLNKGARQAASRSLNRSILEIAANIDLAEDGQTKYDLGRNRTYDPDGKAMERLMSRWEQWNGYMLESSDAWFKGMASGSAEQAIREANAWGEDNLRADERESLSTEEAEKLTKDRQKELDEVKKQIAKYRTFQNDGVTAEAANEIRDWLNKKGAKLIGKEWKKGQFGLGTALMPYTKVPTNLAVKSLEFSPLGAAKGLAEMIKVMNDPKATMAQQNKAVTDFGRGMTGTALIALLAGLMKNAPWFKDWEAEEDKDVKAQNKAEGKSGVQVNWSMLRRYIQGDKNPEWQNGDQAVDISSMEPVNQLFTTASLIADGMPAGEALFRSSKDNLMGMPSLQALTNIENNIKYTDTPEDGWQTLLTTAGSTFGSVAGGMLPAPLRHAGTAADQYARDTSGNNAIERAWNQTLSSIPYARTTLPVKTDAFGNPVSAGDDMTRIKNQYLPFKYSQVNQSDASREIERIRKETGENYMPARTGPKSVQYGSGKNAEKITLTAKERKEYKDDLGQDYQEQVEKLITSTYYKQANDEAKAAMIAALESYTKDTAKVNFADEHDIDYDGNYAGVRELKNPGQYLGIRAGFTTGIKNEDFSSVDALLKSAKRMPEKDRQYMREHTDGFSTYYDLAADGVKAKSVDKYQDKLKARIDAAGKKSANGYDIFQTVVQGGFTNKEADAFMNRTKSDGSFYAGKGRHAVYEAVRAAGGSPSEALELWDVMDKNGNGTLTKSEFKAAIKKVPKDKRSAVSKAIREAMGW